MQRFIESDVFSAAILPSNACIASCMSTEAGGFSNVKCEVRVRVKVSKVPLKLS